MHEVKWGAIVALRDKKRALEGRLTYRHGVRSAVLMEGMGGALGTVVAGIVLMIFLRTRAAREPARDG